MGLDLTMLPLSGPEKLKRKRVYCVDKLKFERDSRIFSQLTRVDDNPPPTIETHLIPDKMQVKIDGTTNHTDGYGHKLRFAYVKDLKRLNVCPDTSQKNKKIKACIDLLPDNTPVILYWW
jgi:hypothetical protein